MAKKNDNAWIESVDRENKKKGCKNFGFLIKRRVWVKVARFKSFKPSKPTFKGSLNTVTNVAGNTGDAANLTSCGLSVIKEGAKSYKTATSCAETMGSVGAVLTGPVFGGVTAVISMGIAAHDCYQDRMEKKHDQLQPYLYSYLSGSGDNHNQLTFPDDLKGVAFSVLSKGDFKQRSNEDIGKFVPALREFDRYFNLHLEVAHLMHEMIKTFTRFGGQVNSKAALLPSEDSRKKCEQCLNKLYAWEKQHLEKVIRRFNHHATYTQVPLLFANVLLNDMDVKGARKHFIDLAPKVKLEVDGIRDKWKIISKNHSILESELRPILEKPGW